MSLADQLAAVQDWWRDAGVDCAFVDDPQSMWTGEAEDAAPPPALSAPRARLDEPAPEPAAPRIAVDGMPDDLAAFRRWWCDPATPLPGPNRPRLASAGQTGAKLMLLAPMPEEGDADTLLAGPQGRMLRAMLAALGVAEGEAFLAAALPAHMAMPDWDALKSSGLDAIIAHQIALAAPQNLLLLGNPLVPLVGQSDLPMLATLAPDQLLAHPRERARLWKRLLDWMPAE